jgi:hypothetical protein
MQMNTAVILVLFATWIGLSVASMNLFYRRLRRLHYQIRCELGSPVLFDGTSDNFAVGRFLWLGGHRRLGDHRLDQRAAWIRVLGTFCGASLVFGMTYVPLARFARSLELATVNRLLLSSLLVTSLAILVITARLVRRLHEAHGDEWRRLGSPAAPWLGGPVTQFRFIGFLWSLRFLSLADRRIASAGFVLLGLSVAFLAILALLRL